MKILEKFVLILYSFLVLVISVITCLIVFKLVDIDNINTWIQFVLNDFSLTIVVLAIAVICILLSIRCLFFRKRKEIKKSNTTDILLENESGRLLISKTAIENFVKNIVANVIDFSKDCKVVVDIDPANNLSIYISMILLNDAKVRELTIELQQKIKEKVKENFDLDVKQVNIKIDATEQKQIVKKETIEEKRKKIEEKKEVNEQKLNKEDKELNNKTEINNNIK